MSKWHRRMGSSGRRRYMHQILCGRTYVECHYCGVRLTAETVTLDHVVPACVQCNRKRGDTNYHRFVKKVVA